MEPAELLAANSILKRGVRYKIPAPLFLRLFGKRHINITITQLTIGTELRIAALLISNNITEEAVEKTDPAQMLLTHYRAIVTMVALASLNRRRNNPIVLWFRKLVLATLSVWQLWELWATIRQYSGTHPFMNITGLAIATRLTKPNPGREEKGS